jgi:hypothetical protein
MYRSPTVAQSNGRVQQFKTHHGSIVEAEPLHGTFSLIAPSATVLRKYHAPGQFTDYDIRGPLSKSGDIDVTLSNDVIWIYQRPDGTQYVDWSPRVLGYQAIE